MSVFPSSGVAPEPVPGGIGARLVARFIDGIVSFLPIAPVVLPRTTVDSTGQIDLGISPQLFLVLTLTVGALYETVAIARWGHTVGKRLLGLRVVRHFDGERPTWSQAFQRWLVPTVPGVIGNVLPAGLDVFTLAVSVAIYGAALWDPQRRGYHDRLSGTRVLDVRPRG